MKDSLLVAFTEAKADAETISRDLREDNLGGRNRAESKRILNFIQERMYRLQYILAYRYGIYC